MAGTPNCQLNPFAIRHNTETDLVFRISSLSSLLEELAQLPLHPNLKAAIDTALSGFYTKMRTNPGGQDYLANANISNFQDYLVSQDHLTLRDELLDLIAPLLTGPTAQLLSTDPIDLALNTSPVISFNLKDIDPPARRLALHLCIEQVWSLAVQNPRNTAMAASLQKQGQQQGQDQPPAAAQDQPPAAAMARIARRANRYHLDLVAFWEEESGLFWDDTYVYPYMSH